MQYGGMAAAEILVAQQMGGRVHHQEVQDSFSVIQT
jgi:hypothetical protein